MAELFRGRYTATKREGFVVFLIGMRVNRPWQFWKWLPTAAAMPKMMQALAADPARGYLGGEAFFRPFPLTTLMVSYWRSFEDLERFARDPKSVHLPAWAAFMKRVGADGSVGIWHETYKVAAGEYEAIYANMPRFGLGAAADHEPVGRKRASARARITAADEPEKAAETV